ncbi:MAG: hypothetical protein DRO04_02635 [Candidatus Iainarchaeum archaeon]|uniref:Uncharacterized protein n=1 Tax=Candidatus Iainarchaeum sp. TaxID=3101447 RepID=A0A497JGC3_9ARCH|nr:MAG: hypothetical protein DRO04_02635 [Candidatus Diapherotrites archaeon]
MELFLSGYCVNFACNKCGKVDAVTEIIGSGLAFLPEQTDWAGYIGGGYIPAIKARCQCGNIVASEVASKMGLPEIVPHFPPVFDRRYAERIAKEFEWEARCVLLRKQMFSTAVEGE